MVTTIAMFYFYYKIYKTLKESTQNLNAHSTEDGVTPLERRRKRRASTGKIEKRSSNWPD